METDARHLMALLSAYAVTISALLESHPEPQLLQRAFARCQAQIPPELDGEPELYGVYQATLDTFARSIPTRRSD